MNNEHNRYCIDANVLIQAWQKYYSPRICPDYWDILSSLGKDNRIFLPEIVFEEITRTEDDLADWLKTSGVSIEKITEPITNCLTKIYNANKLHLNLVDNTKQRSLADPWLIAHAMHGNSCVVTKEERVTTNTPRIKIPNVCDNMGIKCINDFQMLEELGIKFKCYL